MKKSTTIIAVIATILALASCSDDSNRFDPYKEQTKMPIYPKSLSFKSVNNDGATTAENWAFNYNSDNTIKNYTYEHAISSGDTDIRESRQGALRYYVDYTGSRCIETTIYSKYSSKRPTSTLVYTDTITEFVKFDGDYISSIRTSGWRTTNGIAETISSNRVFTYAKDFCTSSTYDDKTTEIAYSYKWHGERLVQATVHKQSKESSNMTYDTHNYTYNRKEIAKDYGFNIMAFVYAHTPEVYSAMNFFGKGIPYKLESKEYDSYGMRNGREYEIESELHYFTIMEDKNTVTILTDSPGYSEYIYIFQR